MLLTFLNVEQVRMRMMVWVMIVVCLDIHSVMIETGPGHSIKKFMKLMFPNVSVKMWFNGLILWQNVKQTLHLLFRCLEHIGQ